MGALKSYWTNGIKMTRETKSGKGLKHEQLKRKGYTRRKNGNRYLFLKERNENDKWNKKAGEEQVRIAKS